MELKTLRLKFRELSLFDVDNIHHLHSLPETDQFNTLGVPHYVDETKNLVMDWINVQYDLPRMKYIFCLENSRHNFIGLLGLNLGKLKYRNAEIWYKLHPNFWNQGYAIEAVKAILFFCFTQLKLHRVEAGCATANIASIKVLEKSGMIKEGQKRKLLPIRGEWFDNYEYAILEEDFIQ